MNKIFFKIKKYIERNVFSRKYYSLYNKYKEFTMIPPDIFAGNLILSDKFMHIEGCIVECGVWRGGMSAAMKEISSGERMSYLFDSFEGLPEVHEIDGESAVAWQADKNSEMYYDNCAAEIAFAEKAMRMTGSEDFKIIKGWFNETLPDFNSKQGISILRLDGDWYDSTMCCLINLFDKVVKGGIIIIDDYYIWDGCSRAVHDFLSKRKRTERIMQSDFGVCYIIKS